MITVNDRVLEDVLACPNCHGPIVAVGEGWNCAGCGVVGRTTLGFLDFLPSAPVLPMAADGEMDLGADERTAAELQRSSTDLDFGQLCELLATLHVSGQDRSTWPTWRRRAQERFHRNLAKVNAQGEAKGGEAILSKIDRKLTESSWPPVGGGLALEAGGGEGLFLSAFCSRFEHVVFVDASVANLVLATKAAQERELRNVSYVRADVTHLPFRNAVFDFVHQNGVVEHVYDPVQMTREGVRVRGEGGYYVCVSPNGTSITPEPHFGLPMFRLLPDLLRRTLIPLVRGGTFEMGGTDPRSLRQLRTYIESTGEQETLVYFLPRHLPFTARQTVSRRLVRSALSTRLVGNALDGLLNVVLLPIVPQHILIARSPKSSPATVGR